MFAVNRFSAGILFLLVGLASSAWPQERGRAGRMETSVHRSEAPREALLLREAKAIREMPRPSRHVSLGAVDPREAQGHVRKPGLSPIGISRALPADAIAKGEWSASSEGKRVWRLAMDSAGAKSLRIHFSGFNARDGKVWMIGRTETAGPYTGRGPLGDGDFWSDLVDGESVIVAYEPGSTAPASGAPPFRIPEISHQFEEAIAPAAPAVTAADATVKPLAAAASCALDVTCYPEYAAPASAVALMVFQSGGSAYSCTGSLIASASSPAIPFFLTANHCIGSDAEARSLITFFKYQTPVCDGTPPPRSSVPKVLGASYVEGQPIELGDFSLLRLTSFPDTDVTLLGWDASDIAPNQAVAGISHPRGDYKRIAFGQRAPDMSIRFSTGERMPASVGYQVNWTQGVTQSGSSGSPLIAQINGRPYLAGTLSAGPNVSDADSAAVCATENLNASYGRFSAAAPYLTALLSSPSGLSKPVVSAGGVVNAASYQPGIAPAAWVTIFGQSLANITASASVDDLSNGNLPSTLDGVSVKINGKPAFVQYVSPTQINVQAPADSTRGSVPVTVTNAAGTSAPVTVQLRDASPAFFTSGQFAAAVRPDGSAVTATNPARPGEVISLYGNGFGGTTPAVAPGMVGSFEAPLAAAVSVSIGGMTAALSFAGLSAAGLYQFNVTVPSLPNGDYEVFATVNGQSTQGGVFLRVRAIRF